MKRRTIGIGTSVERREGKVDERCKGLVEE